MPASFYRPFERVLDALAAAYKPHAANVARFLIVATFFEDSGRLWHQWADQAKFLKRYRGFPWQTAEVFLAVNVATMLVAGSLLLFKKKTASAAVVLISVIFAQSLGYGILFDTSFIFRMLSVCGGLTLLLAERWIEEGKEWRGLAFGVGAVGVNKATYFQLISRVLYVFLFLSFLFGGDGVMSQTRMAVVACCFVSCMAVAAGFRSKWSTAALTGVVVLANIVLNSWWTLHEHHPRRDLERYDFFQNLSIIGGLLLLQKIGPGALSVDESKKNL